MLCNDSALVTEASPGGGAPSYTPNGAPTEVALLTAGLKAGLDLAAVKAAKPRVASVPFESEVGRRGCSGAVRGGAGGGELQRSPKEVRGLRVEARWASPPNGPKASTPLTAPRAAVPPARPPPPPARPSPTPTPPNKQHKFMATVHRAGPPAPGAPRVIYVKGAPDRLLPMCCGQLAGDGPAQVAARVNAKAKLAPLDTAMWSAAQAELSSQGLRVLALCRWGAAGWGRGGGRGQRGGRGPGWAAAGSRAGQGPVSGRRHP
jgi:magnesium-transporting ATPase (P-type)